MKNSLRYDKGKEIKYFFKKLKVLDNLEYFLKLNIKQEITQLYYLEIDFWILQKRREYFPARIDNYSFKMFESSKL